jgi:hypothetical protein
VHADGQRSASCAPMLVGPSRRTVPKGPDSHDARPHLRELIRESEMRCGAGERERCQHCREPIKHLQSPP